MKTLYHYDDVMPEMVISGPELAVNGFTSGTSVCIQLRDNALWITPVHDEAFFIELLNSPDADIYADEIREDGSLYLAGDWFISLGMNRDSQPASFISKHVIFLSLSTFNA